MNGELIVNQLKKASVFRNMRTKFAQQLTTITSDLEKNQDFSIKIYFLATGDLFVHSSKVGENKVTNQVLRLVKTNIRAVTVLRPTKRITNL